MERLEELNCLRYLEVDLRLDGGMEKERKHRLGEGRNGIGAL